MLKVDVRDCHKYLPSLPSPEDHKSTESENPHLSKQQDLDFLEKNKFYQKLRQSVIPMMINLLSSKESESKAGGLNILGSVCGLSYDF